MSCGAVVLATDGPATNEIVNPGRGVLVRSASTGPRRPGPDHRTDSRALEEAIQSVIGMSRDDKAEIGRRARIWFMENDQAFRVRIASASRARVSVTRCGGGSPVQF